MRWDFAALEASALEVGCDAQPEMAAATIGSRVHIRICVLRVFILNPSKVGLSIIRPNEGKLSIVETRTVRKSVNLRVNLDKGPRGGS